MVVGLIVGGTVVGGRIEVGVAGGGVGGIVLDHLERFLRLRNVDFFMNGRGGFRRDARSLDVNGLAYGAVNRGNGFDTLNSSLDDGC
jgi:hypothetical protein